jgi:hypothetical protein
MVAAERRGRLEGLTSSGDGDAADLVQIDSG